MRKDGNVASKTEILDHVWGMDFAGDPNVVEVYVGYLRKKIDVPFGVESIKTVRGAGYQLLPDVTRMTDEVDTEQERRRSWWPQTVRVRLDDRRERSAFVITISLAAVGLVRLVHNDLLDGSRRPTRASSISCKPPCSAARLHPRGGQILCAASRRT